MDLKICDVKACHEVMKPGSQKTIDLHGHNYDLCEKCHQQLIDWIKETFFRPEQKAAHHQSKEIKELLKLLSQKGPEPYWVPATPPPITIDEVKITDQTVPYEDLSGDSFTISAAAPDGSLNGINVSSDGIPITFSGVSFPSNLGDLEIKDE